jgi:hypothetical protein
VQGNKHLAHLDHAHLLLQLCEAQVITTNCPLLDTPQQNSKHPNGKTQFLVESEVLAAVTMWDVTLHSLVKGLSACCLLSLILKMGAPSSS